MVEMLVSTGLRRQKTSMLCTLVNLFSCIYFQRFFKISTSRAVFSLLCSIKVKRMTLFLFFAKQLLLLKGGIETLVCDLGHSKNQTDNHMDMQFLFCPQKSILHLCDCASRLLFSKAQWSTGEYYPMKEHSTEFGQDFLCCQQLMNGFFLECEWLILFNPRLFIFYKHMV